MNDFIANRRLYPATVITVYKDKHGYEFYLEERPVMTVAGKKTLGPAIPLADDVLKNIATTYTKTANPETSFGGGIIPQHVLYASYTPAQLAIIWYRPAMPRVLNFTNAVKLKAGTVLPIPATLYLLLNGSMFVFALQANNRPDEKTKLFNAPFYNVYSSGNICLGTAHVGKNREKSFQKELERYEKGFYMAEMTHAATTTCKTPLDVLWPRLAKSKAPFPKAELIQHKTYKTLGDLITMVNKKGGANG